MSGEGALGRWVRSAWAIPLFTAVLGLAARLYGLGGKPLWYDEVLTLKRATLPLGDLIADSFHNKHYPLYFLLTKPLATTTDWSEATLRIPACVFGAVSVLMAARIAHAVAGGWAALTAGALMALSPLEVQYGQEARPYTLASAAILIATWGLVRTLGTQVAPIGAAQSGQRTGWLAYGLGMAVALNTIGAAAPCFVAINVSVLALAGSKRLPPDWPLRTWLLTNLAVLVMWLPGLMALMVASSGDASRGLNWVPPFTLQLARTVLASLYMFQLSDLLTFERLSAPVPLLGFSVLALAGAGGVLAMRSRLAFLLVGLAVAMPATLVLISLAKPLFVPRYLLWGTGPYFILAGIGLASIGPVALRAAVAIAVMCGAAVSLAPYYAVEAKPRWDLAAAYLAQHSAPGDAGVVSSGLARLMLGTYAARTRRDALGVLELDSRDQIMSKFARGANVWVIYGRAGQGGNLITREMFAARWAELGPPRQSATFGRHIVIWRHARDPASR